MYDMSQSAGRGWIDEIHASCAVFLVASRAAREDDRHATAFVTATTTATTATATCRVYNTYACAWYMLSAVWWASAGPVV
jgi:hypothetical protein